MCVLGGGEISGSRCDVASSWCLSCLCFLQLVVYREFSMDTMQMVVAIPLCFGSFVHHLWLALLCKIHTNTDEYWVDVITSAYGERPAWAAPIKRMRKRVATKECVRRLRGSVSQNLISDLVWTSFAPRSGLVKMAED